MGRHKQYKLDPRPCLPFKYLKVYEGYKGPHDSGAYTLELDTPGPLVAPCDLKLIDYFSDLSGETIILESVNYVLYRDKSETKFTMMMRQNKQDGFIVKQSYKKGESLGYINASHLFFEVTKGQYSGFEHHLYNTIEADTLFMITDIAVVNHGQPLHGGRPLSWSGIARYASKRPKHGLHIGDRVYSLEGKISDQKEQFGETVYYVDSLHSYMGEDYLRINRNKASLKPSIVADIKESLGQSYALVNGDWIAIENLIERKGNYG